MGNILGCFGLYYVVFESVSMAYLENWYDFLCFIFVGGGVGVFYKSMSGFCVVVVYGVGGVLFLGFNVAA